MNLIKFIITIVTPSFNQDEFIEETIKSIWSQEGDFNIEHIIADGGSTDDSVNIIKQYEKLLLSGNYDIKCNGIQLIWWSRADEGQTAALNEALNISSGDVLGWINSDDLFYDVLSLQKIKEAFINNCPDIVTGDAVYINTSGNEQGRYNIIDELNEGFLSKNQLDNLLRIDFIPQPSTFFKSKVFQKIRFDQSCHISMDWDFWITAYKKGFRFYKVNKIISRMRKHEEAKTYKHGITFFKEKVKIYNKYRKFGLNYLYSWLMIIYLSLRHNRFMKSIIERILISLHKVKKVFLKDHLPL